MYKIECGKNGAYFKIHNETLNLSDGNDIWFLGALSFKIIHAMSQHCKRDNLKRKIGRIFFQMAKKIIKKRNVLPLDLWSKHKCFSWVGQIYKQCEKQATQRKKSKNLIFLLCNSNEVFLFFLMLVSFGCYFRFLYPSNRLKLFTLTQIYTLLSNTPQKIFFSLFHLYNVLSTIKNSTKLHTRN